MIIDCSRSPAPCTWQAHQKVRLITFSSAPRTRVERKVFLILRQFICWSLATRSPPTTLRILKSVGFTSEFPNHVFSILHRASFWNEACEESRIRPQLCRRAIHPFLLLLLLLLLLLVEQDDSQLYELVGESHKMLCSAMKCHWNPLWIVSDPVAICEILTFCGKTICHHHSLLQNEVVDLCHICETSMWRLGCKYFDC